MKVNDAITGAVLIVLAAIVFWLTRDYPGMPGQPYGPALFPRLISVLMALSGLGLIVIGLRTRDGQPMIVPGEWVRSPYHIASVAAVIAAVVFYIWASKALGFVLTGFIVLSGLFLLLRGRAHVWSSLLIAALAVVAIQQFFGQFLRVPLPWGVLQNYAW